MVCFCAGPFNVTGFTLMSGARNVSVGMVVPVPDDQQFNDTRKYWVCLLTDNYAAVMFQRRCTGVTVYDNDGKVWPTEGTSKTEKTLVWVFILLIELLYGVLYYVIVNQSAFLVLFFYFLFV